LRQESEDVQQGAAVIAAPLLPASASAGRPMMSAMARRCDGSIAAP
jgi:hypothetical protein